MTTENCTARKSDSQTEQLFISVIIPVRNEEPFIGQTIDSLLNQSYDNRRFEIIVVDGRSTDRTRAIVDRYCQRFPNVRLLDNSKRLSSAARNVGIRNSQGEIIVIVDGHCHLPDNQLLQNLSNAFQHSRADIVGRPQSLQVDGNSMLQKAIAIARTSWLGHHPDSFVYSSGDGFVPASSCGTAYRREVFEAIGLFDETFDACEDVELNTRADQAGQRCYFSRSVAVHYYPRSSLNDLFRQMARYGRGRVRLARKHPTTLSWKSFAPGLFVVGLIVGLIASLVSSRIELLFAVAIAVYLIIVTAESLRLTLASRDRDRWRTGWRLLFVLPTIHLGAGWGILREGVSSLGRLLSLQHTK